MTKITKKRAKNGRFPLNACLNRLAHFKTGDLATLIQLSLQVVLLSLLLLLTFNHQGEDPKDQERAYKDLGLTQKGQGNLQEALVGSMLYCSAL